MVEVEVAVAPRRTLGRRVLRWALRLVIALVALVAVALLALHSGPGKERLRQRIEQRLGERVNGSVTLAELDYLLLLGDVELSGLTIRDEAGAPAIAVGQLRVAPSWSALIHGDVVVDAIELRQVEVHVVRDAEGGSNLGRLFKPREQPLEVPDRLFTIRRLRIEDLKVEVLQPDGGKLAIDDLDLVADIAIHPKEKSGHVRVTELHVAGGIDKGVGQLRLGLRELRTTLALELDRGAGTLHMDPLHAEVALRLPGREEQRFPFDLRAVDVQLAEGDLGAGIDGLAASAIALASVEAKVRRDSAGALTGEQQADVVGWRIDRAKLHQLLGREILANDVEAEIHLRGPQEGLVASAVVRSGDASITLDGTVGLGVPLSFDAALTLDRVDTEKLLVAGATTAPPMAVRHLRVTARGTAVSKDAVDADVTLLVEDAAVRGIPIERVVAGAHLAGKKLEVRSLKVTTLGQELEAQGKTNLASRHVDLSASLSGDPSLALEGLRASGREVAIRLPRGAVRIPKEGVRLHVEGPLDGDLTATAVLDGVVAFGGRVSLDARAVVKRAPEGSVTKVDVKELGAKLDVHGLSLSSVAALRGRQLPGDAAVDLHVEVAGPPDRAVATFTASAREMRYGNVPLTDLRLGVRGRASRRAVAAHVAVTGRDGATLLAIDADVPLTEVEGRPRPAMNAPFTVKVHAPERSLREAIIAATGIPALGRLAPDATARLDVDLHGTLARPEGTLALDARGRLLPEVDSRLALRGTVATEGDRPTLRVGAEAWLDAARDRTLKADVEASVARSPLLPGPRAPRWAANVELGPIDLATLPEMPARVPRDRIDRVRALGGTVNARLALSGDENDARGTVDLGVRGLGGPGRALPAPVDLTARVELGQDATRLELDVDAAGGRLLEVHGDVGLAGRGLLAAVRAGQRPDPTLDVDVDVTRRPLASLAPLRPALATAPGELGGHLDITGKASQPLVHGALGLGGITAAAGNPTGAGLRIDVDTERIAAVVSMGERGELGEGPLRALVGLRRADLAQLDEGEAPIELAVEADRVPIAELLPAIISADKGVRPQGMLSSSLSLKAALRRRGGAVQLAEPRLGGRLDLREATVGLPGARRAFHDVALGLRAEPGGLVLERLHAEESDVEKKKRFVNVEGRVALDGLKPRSADARITASDWLLFGGTMGQMDAPRGTLTIDAQVDATIDGPRRKVDVRVDRLVVLVPDRFEKAHQSEEPHVGDVFFIGAPGVRAGRLPVPGTGQAKPKVPEGSTLSSAPSQPPPPAPAPPAEGARGTDIRITIADGARVFQSPMDLAPTGTLEVALDEAGRTVRGQLVMRKGELSLGGAMHGLEKGSITFDEAHPAGNLDLWFARRLEKHAQLRDVSNASGGDSIRIHMSGPISDRKTVISGAGSPGALYDLLAMHNAGQPRFVTEPDLPDTGGVEFPQLDDVLILSFLSVNLPHLLFLDRGVAWSDPYDDATGPYGRLDHYDAERTRGPVRLRGTSRPEAVGRSDAEVGLDLLFVDTPTFQAGTGVVAGSRLGGGPGLFLEWSSED